MKLTIYKKCNLKQISLQYFLQAKTEHRMWVSHVSFDVNHDPVGLHLYALFAQAEYNQRTLEEIQSVR